jgi:hypothetical protein
MDKSRRKQRGGLATHAPIQYVNENAAIMNASAGSNLLHAGNNVVRPGIPLMRQNSQMSGGYGNIKRLSSMAGGGCGCGGMPAPIASRNISRNEPLYTAMHARLIGGRRHKNKTHRRHRQSRHRQSRHNKQRGGDCGCMLQQQGGFTPAIMGPVIDNFGYVAPAIGLVAYRYWDQIKNKKKGRRSMKSRK